MDDPTERAAEIQRGVRRDERESLEAGADQYSEAEVRQAIVHTRQDMVLLSSFLLNLTKLAQQISGQLRWMLVILLIMLAAIVLELW